MGDVILSFYDVLIIRAIRVGSRVGSLFVGYYTKHRYGWKQDESVSAGFRWIMFLEASSFGVLGRVKYPGSKIVDIPVF